MRYGELIDGKLILAPRKLPVDGSVVYNPPQELLEANGYKPVRFTDQPAVEPGYIAVPGWEKTAEEIVQTWAVEPEPDEISEDRAYRIITGEEE